MEPLQQLVPFLHAVPRKFRFLNRCEHREQLTEIAKDHYQLSNTFVPDFTTAWRQSGYEFGQIMAADVGQLPAFVIHGIL